MAVQLETIEDYIETARCLNDENCTNLLAWTVADYGYCTLCKKITMCETKHSQLDHSKTCTECCITFQFIPWEYQYKLSGNFYIVNEDLLVLLPTACGELIQKQSREHQKKMFLQKIKNEIKRLDRIVAEYHEKQRVLNEIDGVLRGEKIPN